jgi:hypothetical protein
MSLSSFSGNSFLCQVTILRGRWKYFKAFHLFDCTSERYGSKQVHLFVHSFIIHFLTILYRLVAIDELINAYYIDHFLGSR